MDTYLAGTSEPKVDRLKLIADCAEVSVLWLAFGEGEMLRDQPASASVPVSAPAPQPAPAPAQQTPPHAGQRGSHLRVVEPPENAISARRDDLIDHALYTLLYNRFKALYTQYEDPTTAPDEAAAQAYRHCMEITCTELDLDNRRERALDIIDDERFRYETRAARRRDRSQETA